MEDKSPVDLTLCYLLRASWFWGQMVAGNRDQDGSQTVIFVDKKSNAIPLQASTGPEGSRSLRLRDFKTIAT